MTDNIKDIKMTKRQLKRHWNNIDRGCETLDFLINEKGFTDDKDVFGGLREIKQQIEEMIEERENGTKTTK